MKLLLDTHTFLWFIMGNTKLSDNARKLMEDTDNEKLLSVVSIWEMAIKASLGKLSFAEPFEVLIPQQLKLNGIELLNIKTEHAAIITTLPFHHRDPFDRLLIAQSMVERLPILSADINFDNYPIERVW
ncbi:MAG TPA: type II toxin-antitoxin system VapC family toxin [Candidatus Wunengus sp. YC60]|uniref:type II toxin-antitoxin system VapC family toxin n=1 Tax=Candidatus Wunengus sp. YC60 TaxID=3367697 RepID=UPI004028E500